jgi:hypothetical protein
MLPGVCIRPHEQDADDNVEILGTNIAVSAEHAAFLSRPRSDKIQMKRTRAGSSVKGTRGDEQTAGCKEK